MRASIYDPYSQKFLSEDPIRFKSGDYNLYRYVFNSPLNHADPMGLEVNTCWAWEGKYPHNYVCVDDVCGGQTPRDAEKKLVAAFDSVPGGNQGGPSPSEKSLLSTCSEIPTENKNQSKCLDQCVANSLIKARPNYSLFGNGISCSGFVDQTIANCMAKCPAQK